MDFNSLLVGLDVGTVNSCVVVNYGREFLPLPDKHGKKRIPTCVTLTNKERILGSLSRDCLKDYYETTWFDFKRFIGQVFSEDVARFIAEKVPYNIHIEEPVGPLKFPITFLGENLQFSPEQLLVMHLKHLCKLIYDQYPSKALSCVIGVPICYTESQKHALLSTCELANMKTVKLLNETTAIALAYTILGPSLPSLSEASHNVAFISIGHMHTQVAVCSFNQNRVCIQATSSDAELGGYQFDQIIYDWLCKNLAQRFGRELSPDERRQCLAWLAVENQNVKKSLDHETKIQTNNSILIKIENLFSSDEIKLKLPREVFKKCSQDLLKRLKTTIEECISASKLGINEIHAVEVLGGTCRIIEVKETINNVFGTPCRWTLSSDEAVAMGCALHAAKHRVDLEVLESTGALSQEVKEEYSRMEEKISQMESKIKELQEQHYQLETHIYSLIDGADEFSWVFEDERVSYRERLERNREAIRLDNFELTAKALDHIRRTVDDEREALKNLCEKRKAWIQHWLEISQQLTVQDQYLPRFTHSAEGYVRELELNRWNPQGFLAVMQMKTWLQSSPLAMDNALRSIDKMQEPKSILTTRTIPPIFTHLVEGVKKSSRDVPNEIQREIECLMTSLSVLNKQVLYQLNFEQSHNIELRLPKPTNLQGLQNSIDQWKVDTKRLKKEIASVKQTLSPQGQQRNRLRENGARRCDRPQSVHGDKFITFKMFPVDATNATAGNSESGNGRATINLYTRDGLSKIPSGPSGSTVQDEVVIINPYYKQGSPQTSPGLSRSTVEKVQMPQWIDRTNYVLTYSENFSKCWNEFLEVYNKRYKVKTIKKRMQDLETASVLVQTADYGLEDSTLPSMDSSIYEAQRRAYEAAHQYRSQTRNVMDRVTALLDSTVESFLKCYSERCTATVSCSFTCNAEQLDKVKQSLENIKSKHGSYMSLGENIKSALSKYAADLPGYRSLMQNT